MQDEFSTINAKRLQIKIINPDTKEEIASFISRIAVVSWVELEDPEDLESEGQVKNIAAGTYEQLTKLTGYIVNYFHQGWQLAEKARQLEKNDIKN